MTPFDAPGKKPFENTVGKEEIARKEQFLLFPQCFLTCLGNFLPFSSNLKLSSANSLSSEESKICRLVMGYFCQAGEGIKLHSVTTLFLS